ncbi:glycosyltransferase [Campylobacter lari]|nr:glycosyltransferase [Campylobacter lari]
MRIAIISRNSSSGYSGGRYHSWVLAEQMSTFSDVVYFTDNKPIFINDYQIYNYHANIQIKIVDSDFIQLSKEVYTPNIVVLIPHLSYDLQYFKNVIRYSLRNKSKLILLNFESPNWFNLYSPIQKDYKLWDGWLLTSKFADCILSASKESNYYASQFYLNNSDSVFKYCYPPINSKVADTVFLNSNIFKEKRIGISARFYNAEHKGVFNIPDLLSRDLEGFTFVLVIGTGDIPANIKYEIFDKAEKYNINIEIKKSLSDYEKFVEMKRAQVWLFPSLFEGFGYPPIEAQYLNTHCVAFELPVLRETSPRIFHAKLGDFENFKLKIKEAISHSDKDYRKEIQTMASFDESTRKLKEIIEEISKAPGKNIDKYIHLVKVDTKDLLLNMLGIKRRKRLNDYYNLYYDKKISLTIFVLICFFDIFLRKFTSKKIREKIRDIYYILKR